MTGDANKGAVLVLLISPHLRLDVVNIHALALCHRFRGAFLGFPIALAARVRSLGRVSSSEDLRFGRNVHVVINLVFQIEVGDVLGDRIITIREVEAHRCLQPLRIRPAPGAADQSLVVIAACWSVCNAPCVDHHDAATALHIGLD